MSLDRFGLVCLVISLLVRPVSANWSTPGNGDVGHLDLQVSPPVFVNSLPPNWDDNTTAFVGYTDTNGTAELRVWDSQELTANVLHVGCGVGVTGILSLAGSNVSFIAGAGGDFTIGRDGIGIANVTNGAMMLANEFFLGENVGGSGIIIVSGTGSRCLAYHIKVGDAGLGRIEVTDSGLLNSNWRIRDDGASSIDLDSGGAITFRYHPEFTNMADLVAGITDGTDNIRFRDPSSGTYKHYSDVAFTNNIHYHFETRVCEWFYYFGEWFPRTNTQTLLVAGLAEPGPAPSGQTTTELSLGSACLAWEENGSAARWDLLWGAEGFNPSTEGTLIAGITNTLCLLEGLSEGQRYDWYVRASEYGRPTGWTGPDTFRTLSSQYQDSFDSDTSDLYVSDDGGKWAIDTNGVGELAFAGFSSVNDCWWYMLTAYAHATNANVGISAVLDLSSYDANGRAGVVLSADASNAGGEGFLVYVDASGTWRLLTPDSGMGYAPLGDDHDAGVALGSMSGTGVYEIYAVFDRLNASSGHVRISLSVRRPSGPSLSHEGIYTDVADANQVGFRTRYTGNSCWMRVESIDILPITCSAPTNLQASSVSGTSADLGWAETGIATRWDIEIGVSGFTPTGTPTVTGTTSNPHSCDSFLPSGTYEWYVRADNGAGDTSFWSGPHAFATDLAAPYSQNFDSVPNAGDLPAGWTNIVNADNVVANVNTYSGGPRSSPYLASLWNFTDGTAELLLISAEFCDLGTQANQIRFYGCGADDVIVGTIADPTDGATFTPLETVALTGSWIEHTVSLSTYSGTDRYFAFKHAAGGAFRSVGIDDLHYEVAGCTPPSGQSVSSVTRTNVTLSWAQNEGTPSSWGVEYGETGFSQGNGTHVTNIASTTHELNGLDENTSYEWYVNATYPAGRSIWAGPHGFTTDVYTISAPYTQTFDNVTAPDLPDHWTRILETRYSGEQLEVVSHTADSAPNCAYLRRYTDDTAELLLITPCVGDTLTNCQLRFVAKGYSGGETLEVGMMGDPADSETFVPFHTNTLTASYSEYIVPFDTYTGSDRYIALRHASECYTALYVDNIVYEEPTESTESDQTISGFTPTNGSAFVTTDTPTLSATASSGLDVTFAVVSGDPGTLSGGTNLAFTGAGTVRVTASQAGNVSYNAAPTLTNTYTVTAAGSSSNGFNVLRSRQDGDDVVLDLEARVGKTYRVYRRDNSFGASRSLHSTNVASSTSFSITDTNVIGSGVSVRFYDVVEDDGGVLTTNATIYATYVTPTVTGQWYRLSMPIDLGASNRLDSTLGELLRSGATGDALSGDLLYAMTATGSWHTFALGADNSWRVGTPTGAAATNELASGQAFWMKRRSSGSDTNAVYTGPVITTGTPITFGSNTWQLIAWPFPAPRREDAGTNGWGFAAAGAQTGTSWMTADNVWVDGKLLWLHADGRWRKSNGSSAADMQLEAMNGYYYLHRGAGFTWTPED